MTIFYIVSGFSVGLLVGMTGVGGGSLMTPLLTLFFGVSPTAAVGTDLAFAAITKSVGTFTHRLRGTVNWSIVARLCLGALPAALAATLVLSQLGALDEGVGQVIRYSIGLSVLLTACALLFRGKMLYWINAHPEYQLKGRALSVTTVIVGAILGGIVTISSIGAGAIGATVLVFLYPRLSPATIAGTDIAYAVPLTAVAALGHWWLGSIHWVLLGSLLIGSIPGIALGSWIARLIPEKILRGALAMTLALVATKMLA